MGVGSGVPHVAAEHVEDDSGQLSLLPAVDNELVQRLRARGVLLRGCANYPGLGPGWYRAAVRTHSENSAFLQALGEVL